jgi:amino acid transporter
MLGKMGFSIITVAALISTFSAINASLYGGSRVNYEIAQDDELPHHFLAKLWNQPIGLMITAVATLILVNILKLESISTAGSVGFLLIFGIVNLVGFLLSIETGSNKLIPLVGFVLCIIATIILINQQYATNTVGVIVSITIIGFCFLMEWIYKKSEKN